MASQTTTTPFGQVSARRKAVNGAMTVLIYGAFALALIPLLWLSATVVSRGVDRFMVDGNGDEKFNLDFLNQSMRGIFGGMPEGGIAHAIAGTLSITLAATLISVPIGLFVVRATEEMLKLVPNELREASYALGVPKWLTILKVVIRTAAAGITTGVTLAIARVIGETAPLLIAVGVADSYNLNLFDGRMMTLPVYIVSEWRKGDQPCNNPEIACVPEITEYRAWAAALVLILIVMALNLVARLVSKYFSPKTGR